MWLQWHATNLNDFYFSLSPRILWSVFGFLNPRKSDERLLLYIVVLQFMKHLDIKGNYIHTIGERETRLSFLVFGKKKMKGFGLLFILLVTGTAAFMYLGYLSNGSTTSNPGVASIYSRKAMPIGMKRSKLVIKGKNFEEDNEATINVNLEDYGVIDPVPSSTNSIKPGPIQHGTPLLPYIPELPSPPPKKQVHFP